MRFALYALFFAAATLATYAMSQLSYRYFHSEELAKAEGRLTLYQASVVAELERFSHLTYVLARDPFVIETAQSGATEGLSERLLAFSDQAGLDAIYLMDTDGLTIAASNAGQPNSFLGQNYSFRPYFQSALGQTQGRFYGIGATTGLPGYFIADGVNGRGGETQGVIAIKIDLSDLQDSWRNSGEQVMLVNSDGVVLLSSDPSWLYHALTPLTPEQREAITQSRQFPGQDLLPLDWLRTEDGRANIAGDERLHLTTTDMPHGWELHYFASDSRDTALAWLTAATVVLVAGAFLVLYQIQRARRAASALRRSEEEEAKLREANERLAVEIDERRTAERRLRRTQRELEQASRLAALGQLAASVTHELGQPIAAMRNQVAAAEIAAKADSGFTGKIGGLVDRMEGITRQLKFFARSEDERFQDVDLSASMRAALALVEPNITTLGVTVDLDLPDSPALVRGIGLRLEQVMTNLLRNAIDAMEDSDDARLQVSVGRDSDTAWFEIRDHGHGLGDATLADLQEPFVTTRASGQGMGLGLAISASIVTDHEGTMQARNANRGGAVFRVNLPLAPPIEAPPHEERDVA